MTEEILKDGGRTDYWAPDSSLDRNPLDQGVEYLIYDNYKTRIYVNDWVDLDPSKVPDNDPLWGGSRQVVECNESHVVVRMYDEQEDLYKPCAISPEIIYDNYMHEPKWKD